MGMNLSDALKFVRVKPDGSGYTVVAGSTNLTGDTIDTSDCEGVIIVTGFGTITSGAATSVKAQGGAASNLSDAADLLGTAITVADTDDNKVTVMDIYRPAQRYVRQIIARATQNAVIDFCLVIKYGVKTLPITIDTTVSGKEVHASPAAGTA